MALPGVAVGQRLGPFAGRLDRDLLGRYAEITGVPPLAVVTQIWDAQLAGHATLVPEAVRADSLGGVHAEHDVVLHRPVVPGEPLETWVEGHGARPAGRHAMITLRYSTFGGDGALVAEQWWTTAWLQTACEPVGEPPPPHPFPEEARARLVGSCRFAPDADMPRRYAEVSGDWSAHHFDVEAARRAGFERTFLHGLCTMALCAQAVVSLAAGGDPGRVRRVAVRFASPTFLGDDLDVQVYDAGEGVVAFEAEAGGAPVIRNGRAELRDDNDIG